MAATTYATPGKLYLTPTKVKGDTSTLNAAAYISGIVEREISAVMVSESPRLFRNGVGVNAGVRVVQGRVAECRLIVPLLQQDTTALKILLSHLTTDGTTIRPTGGTAAAEFALTPTFAMILRPDSTGEKYLYAPHWAVSPNTLQLITHARTRAQLDGVQLELIATRPSTLSANVPPFAWASSSSIASIYSLTEGP